MVYTRRWPTTTLPFLSQDHGLDEQIAAIDSTIGSVEPRSMIATINLPHGGLTQRPMEREGEDRPTRTVR